MNLHNDLIRLRTEYADRARRLTNRDIYSIFNRANQFAIQSRQRTMLDALQKHGLVDLPNARILEMGCGGGGVLAEFRWLGASPYKLFGIDLLPDRLASAHQLLPEVKLLNANGQFLPFSSASFDLILQFTAISSVLDLSLRGEICREIVRVTRPGGLILSYDFWINPTNPQTRGLPPAEIRTLFPGCVISFNRITLAPPIARKLAGLSWLLCTLLESLKVFNTHYLATIRVP